MKTIFHPAKKVFDFILILLIIITFSGCASKKLPAQDPFFSKWRAMAEISKGNSPAARPKKLKIAEKKVISDPVKTALKNTRPLPMDPITMRVHKAEVSVLLRALARSVNLNIMINENVKGKISINVKKAPWEQVFTGILKTRGFSYVWEDSIIRVITIEDKTARLKQLETEQQIKAKTREMEMDEPLLTQIIKIDYANAGKLKDNLLSFLTTKSENNPLGSVMVDKHTNSLIIQAIHSDLKRMLPIIEALDKPTPQILIEAHIVETSSATARELGIQWGGLYNNKGNWITSGNNSPGVMGQSLNSGTGIDPVSGMAINFPANIPLGGAGFTLGFVTETLGKNILAMQLSALQKEGKLNILSSPSITTLDNQTALIESGDQVPFQTVEDGDVKIEYKKAVLSLKVTPHVIHGNTLKMKIITNKDELDFSRTVAGNPTVITKKAETNVILFDGQTTVIGGLNKETKGVSKAGVPFLQDIPLLGHLFKSQGNTNKMEEVLIFITPNILKVQEIQ